MSDYEIGRDIQDLRARLERLEGEIGWKAGGRMREQGVATRRHEVSGAVSDTPPHVWKLGEKEPIPPFLASILRLPLPLPDHFDVPPQSKTWTCFPEPLKPTVYWDGGGSDEFYQFKNQTFSVLKWTNPNTGETYGTVTYSATLIASGRARADYGGYSKNGISITVRGAGGEPLFPSYQKDFSVACNENSIFIASPPVAGAPYFDPGMFDLVAGATWQLDFDHILRC